MEWDDNQEWFCEEHQYNMMARIAHQGIIVEASALEVFHEIECYRFYPKYYVASESEKRKMIVKALWNRLNNPTENRR